jgi:hypothetical protein
MNRWGLEGPPHDAYSRVANVGRFKPLHAFTSDLIDRLNIEFDVARTEGFGLDRELEQMEIVLPSVGLMPPDAKRAPLVVAFTAFPGVHVRFGRWYTRAFPACGCDACDETFEGESELLSWMIHQLTEGRYREAIRKSSRGDSFGEHEFWSLDGRRSGGDARLSEGLDGAAHSGGLICDWQPWPRRQDSSQIGI